MTSSDGGLHLWRVEEQLLRGGSHSDLLSSPVQTCCHVIIVIHRIKTNEIISSLVVGFVIGGALKSCTVGVLYKH